MSSTQMSSDPATEASGGTAVPLRLEVVVIPVGDVDRAGDDYRLMQLTPPASNASHDVDVSEVFHDAGGGLGGGFIAGTEARAAGPDPQGAERLPGRV